MTSDGNWVRFSRPGAAFVELLAAGAPLLDQSFPRPQAAGVGAIWRMDETYVRVKGAWKYLYRAVDKAGATVDFLFDLQTGPQSRPAFLTQGDRTEWHPEKITIDKSGANTAAIESYNTEHEAGIEIRQVKYLRKSFVGSTSQSVRLRLQPLVELHAVPGKATIRADHR